MVSCINCRHLRALLKKNWIYWKRQYLISAAEILFPVVLMGIILLARLKIDPDYVTERDFYQQMVVDKLDLTPEQWDIIYPVIQEELKFPKVNYVVYPFYYKKGMTAVETIQKEQDNYSFLGYQARARYQLDPGPCTVMTPARTFIGLYPNDTYTRMIEQQLRLWAFQYSEDFGFFVNFNVLYFKSEQQMMNYVAHDRYEVDSNRPGLCAGISHYQDANGGHTFKMHFTDQEADERQSIPNQKDVPVDKYETQAQIEDFVNYNKNFYTYFQNWMANAVLRNVTGISDATIINLLMQMKVDVSEIDKFSIISEFLFPLAVTLMYIMPIHRMIMRIVSEKQTKIRENMRMMGLSDTSYWLSWFIFYACNVTVISLISTGIICSKVFELSDWGLIFLFFWLFGISLFGYIIFIQSFFTNGRTASIMSILIYFFTSFADFAVKSNYIEEYRKILASILPTIAMARGISNISHYEQGKIGLQTTNLDETYHNYTVRNCYYMFAVGLVLSYMTGIYLTNVLPTTSDGLRKKWYYPFTKQFWVGTKRKSNPIVPEYSIDSNSLRQPDNEQSRELDRSEMAAGNDQSAIIKERQQYQSSPPGNQDPQPSERSPRVQADLIDKEFEMRGLNPMNYEPVDQGFAQKQEGEQQILKVVDLQKTYANGFKAVKGLNVKMYNGQIFALLGHNGAGKTTTISMLTGLLSSTSGKAEVFGYDLFDDLENVRQFLGVCPQHDILFDLLTPEEHLDIFCDFKGVDKQTKMEEIRRMLIDVDIIGNKNTEAKNLSGGNRRKLSVGIALIGGSKFVLLDEPTAGMDLGARRKLWNMLKKYKNNRIIILTTHYMDEADILGDRIGIMTGGQLTCLGSSLFLKNRFGVGYNLTMVKKSKEPNFKVIDYLQEKFGPTIKKLSEVGSEISYQIPTALSYRFKDFFQSFDNDLDQLDLRSYGISVTTLEEVFLRVGHMTAQEINNSNEGEAQKSREDINVNHDLEKKEDYDDYSIAEQHERGICRTFCIHLGALFRKRYLLYRRNYKTLLVEVFIPALLVLLGFAFSKIQFFKSSPDRKLVAGDYPGPQRLVVNSNLIQSSGNDFFPKQIIQSLPNYGTQFQAEFIDYSSVDVNDDDDGEKAYIKQFDSDVFESRLEQPYSPFRYGSYFIYQADKTQMQFKVATLVNITSQDAAAYYSQFIYQAILRQVTNNPDYKFDVVTAPFPVTKKLKDTSATANGVFVVFVVSIAFALIPAVVVSYILVEREKNLKHMQLISGMSLAAYWISNYVFDISKALITSGIAIGLMYAFSVSVRFCILLLQYDYTWIFFLIYPIGVIPFTYVTSFIFTNENLAQTTTLFVHFIIGGIGAIAAGILRIIYSTYDLGDLLYWIFKMIPSFCLTSPIMYQSLKETLFQERPDQVRDDLEIQAIGGDFIIMLAHGLFWLIILILLESGAFRWATLIVNACRRKTLRKLEEQDTEADEDVREEEIRVEKSPYDLMKVRVNKFSKAYFKGFNKPFVAVQKASFGLDYGECFALLGVNGAGKTTTFKSLTGDINPTSGEIHIDGMDIQRNFSKIRKLIGYCPQHDAIFDLMTVEEHLYYYAQIKGILKDKRYDLVEKQIKDMNLTNHRKKLAGTLSGGNKRKLSVAICVLGNPPIILLDEPSAGMDPEARRFMWSVVAKISQQRKKSAVILTTHSMEEAEALSTKMGIMVKGGIFKCYGSSQHIKNKFGTDYEIEVKIRKLSNDDLLVMAHNYGFEVQTMTDLDQVPEIMRKKMLDEFLIEQLSPGGLGHDLVVESDDNKGMVSVKNLLNWIYIEQFGLKIIQDLCEKFEKVDILEHYSDYYKFRIPRGNKSIGTVFSIIENKKEEYKISEYSVSQTTLEQIFQTFANQKIDEEKRIMTFQNKNGFLRRLNTADVYQQPVLSQPEQNSKDAPSNSSDVKLPLKPKDKQRNSKIQRDLGDILPND